MNYYETLVETTRLLTVKNKVCALIATFYSDDSFDVLLG